MAYTAAMNGAESLARTLVACGIANIHNARRANSPMVNIVGDHATYHRRQALWTQARERLDVVNVVFANRAYRILQGELVAVGARPGPASRELFDLSRPALDWVKLSQGMGVEAAKVDTLQDFAKEFAAACARRGPFPIELVI